VRFLLPRIASKESMGTRNFFLSQDVPTSRQKKHGAATISMSLNGEFDKPLRDALETLHKFAVLRRWSFQEPSSASSTWSV